MSVCVVGFGREEASAFDVDDSVDSSGRVEGNELGNTNSGACQRRHPCSRDDVKELKKSLSNLDRPKSDRTASC